MSMFDETTVTKVEDTIANPVKDLAVELTSKVNEMKLVSGKGIKVEMFAKFLNTCVMLGNAGRTQTKVLVDEDSYELSDYKVLSVFERFLMPREITMVEGDVFEQKDVRKHIECDEASLMTPGEFSMFQKLVAHQFKAPDTGFSPASDKTEPQTVASLTVVSNSDGSRVHSAGMKYSKLPVSLVIDDNLLYEEDFFDVSYKRYVKEFVLAFVDDFSNGRVPTHSAVASKGAPKSE